MADILGRKKASQHLQLALLHYIQHLQLTVLHYPVYYITEKYEIWLAGILDRKSIQLTSCNNMSHNICGWNKRHVNSWHIKDMWTLDGWLVDTKDICERRQILSGFEWFVWEFIVPACQFVSLYCICFYLFWVFVSLFVSFTYIWTILTSFMVLNVNAVEWSVRFSFSLCSVLR